jgi:hypothetical protein
MPSREGEAAELIRAGSQWREWWEALSGLVPDSAAPLVRSLEISSRKK